MTSYLPTVNLGFNEIGLNTINCRLPLKSTGVSRNFHWGFTAQILANRIIHASQFSIQDLLDAIQGGRLLSKVHFQRHQLNAASAALRGDISDISTATNSYWDLMYNAAVLQIVAAVNTSEEQVRHNISLSNHGTGHNLDVLQAKTQFAKIAKSSGPATYPSWLGNQTGTRLELNLRDKISFQVEGLRKTLWCHRIWQSISSSALRWTTDLSLSNTRSCVWRPSSKLKLRARICCHPSPWEGIS